MSHGVQYHENGEVLDWFKKHCARRGVDPDEEIQKNIDQGLLELFGHKCWNCGRTWTDGEDDSVNECYAREGCNAR